MVIKVYCGQVLGRPTEDFTDFAETTKVLLDRVLPVEGWRHVPTLDDVAIGGRHAAQALRALPAYATSFRGCGFELRDWGICWF